MPCNDCSRTESCPPCPAEKPAKCEHPNAHLTGASGSSEERIHRYSCPDCKATWEKTERRNVPVEPEPPLTPEEEEQAPEGEPGPEHVCQTYYCPSAGEIESACHGGFDVCCEAPEKHVPADQAPLPPPEGPEYTPCVCGHIVPDHDINGRWCAKQGCECSLYRMELEDEGDSCVYPECTCESPCASAPKPPPQPDRRPPSLVAYSVQGHLYEVALPGDATVQAVDGALVITHGLGPVVGIVQIMPVPSKEGA
jgi:hypothetical protein